MNTDIVKQLQDCFRKKYGRSDGCVCFAPGRLNLIGEHTDYNGGHVFPCALSMGIYGVIAPREDTVLRMYSLDMPAKGITEVSLRELMPGRTQKWTQYPEGVFYTILQRGITLEHGADLMFAGDLPAGSGLSSSAAMEVLTGLMIREQYGLKELSGIDLALLGQKAENKYCGMHCGIMDQFASAMGKKDHAVYLNTDTLEYDLVPLVLGEYGLIITNSNVKHSLVSSAYNDRRRECAEALAALQKVPGMEKLESLGQLNAEQFAQVRNRIPDPAARKRAEHAVRENERTMRAVNALKQNDLEAFGALLNESHISLRDDYEVSCEEMDFLAEQAWKMPGVLGSRMTGGGFGGCTVSIVRKDLAGDFMQELSSRYAAEFGKEASFYQVMPEDGAHVIDL